MVVGRAGVARSRCADCAHDCLVAFSCKGRGLNVVLRIFLRVIAHSLATHSSGAANVDSAARAIDETAVAQVQATLRRRILHAFVGRGLLESFEAKDMLGCRHSGFSVDTSVRIQAQDRAGLERLLRYCARPAFSMERLRKAGSMLVYRCAKQQRH